MTGDNQIRCEKCGDVRCDGTKKMEIEESPDYLMINLARFKYNYRTNLHSKIFKNIHYPEQITIPLASKNGESNEQKRYCLYSVVIHSGLSAYSGHYYAYARSSQFARTQSASWYKLNDSSVGESSYDSFSRITESLSRDVAYLLFYVKEDLKVHLPDSILPDLLHFVYSDNDKYTQELKQKKIREKQQLVSYNHFTPDNFHGPGGAGGFGGDGANGFGGNGFGNGGNGFGGEFGGSRLIF